MTIGEKKLISVSSQSLKLLLGVQMVTVKWKCSPAASSSESTESHVFEPRPLPVGLGIFARLEGNSGDINDERGKGTVLISMVMRTRKTQQSGLGSWCDVPDVSEILGEISPVAGVSDPSA